MEVNCESVTLVSDLLNQTQDRRAAIEHDGFIFTACDVNNFFSLGDTCKGLIHNIQFIERRLRRMQLSDSAVDEHKIRHRHSFLVETLVPAADDFAHALEI